MSRTTGSALVIGGTGPSGPYVVNGLVERGFRTTILHSGRHEPPEIPDVVEHVHTDAYDPDAVRDALADRTFDVCIATYGRLRRNAELLAGRVGQFISVGGFPGYRGYMNAPLFDPPGFPVPTREDAPKVEAPEEDEKGFRIARTEERVFDAQPDATHFRYPWVYGPRQPAPREWSIVRRVLDGRARIVVADGGLSLSHFGYVENLAHALLLAVDHPEKARGRIYNTGDQEVLTIRQVIETIAAAMGHDFEIVSLPWEIAWPARPLVAQPWTTHRIVSLARIESELGYRDVVPPREGLARTARWLAENRPAPGGIEEQVLQDPFDYAAEDALLEAWAKALAGVREPVWAGEAPGYGLAFSGPGGRPRSQSSFEG
ncbi:MAG: NAD-dependent epimerase/dehydratase family protein [Spirochaetaceae bacterium]|mgnify:CR=1 FL=1|nr:NAD-dependent epimerase/dehydratase family protein [Myxococcales bacterium]MCB9722448.1 NAD-dependent epimerase/dehydratase family protein [Spirochaetaceae bacterium]HPG26098.1 NAD-dependent epimerase/dehydratase family protein [Myxococcota bacterium]